ncbi:hypothetical protein DL766_007800 [Monosporascus sp. MC13-8B]|uniref:Uncharacterized protein n=1 Tax=Monosporascus cannonballus TaxID=155416 RepID=A0ABY0H9E6_9PEZI|nr:hypothetical protein DL763_008923 [Monosporascus cannonballus]RYO88210.1 hypothetical protein DL762_003815 [Monosporascus cannonballus]RYP22046.1 hypothetical protein DL766_007800 [Monosporascus sp. MC13-8B]
MHLKRPISLLYTLLSFYNSSSALPFLKWRKTPTISNVPRATYSIVPIDGSGGEGDGSGSDDEPPATVIETQTVVSTHTPTETAHYGHNHNYCNGRWRTTNFGCHNQQHPKGHIPYSAINPFHYPININTGEPNKYTTSFIHLIYLDDFVLREPDDCSSGDHHDGAGAVLHKLNFYNLRRWILAFDVSAMERDYGSTLRSRAIAGCSYPWVHMQT